MKVENDAARYYSPSLNKYVLEEKDRPDDCIVEKFTGFQNKYGTPVFDGDVVCRRQFFNHQKFEIYHIIRYDPETQKTTACYCPDRIHGKDCVIFDTSVDLSSTPEWIRNEFVLCNIHDFDCKCCCSFDHRAERSLLEIESLVPDILVCKKIMEANFLEFRFSIFVWSYNPFEGRWKLEFRSAADMAKGHTILFAPTAEEILKKLPDTIEDYDKTILADFITEDKFKGKGGLHLKIEKNIDEISSNYAINYLDNGASVGLSLGECGNEQLATGLLGAWFFVQENEERKVENENSKK